MNLPTKIAGVIIIIALALGIYSILSKDKSETTTSQTETVQTIDYFYPTWGESMKNIEEAETRTLINKNEATLVYNDVIADTGVIVIYDFTDDKLSDVVIGLQQDLSTPAEFITLFDTFKNLLTEKYGEPTESGVEMSKLGGGELSPEDALAQGFTIHYADFEKDNNKVTLGLLYQDGAPMFSIILEPLQ